MDTKPPFTHAARTFTFLPCLLAMLIVTLQSAAQAQPGRAERYDDLIIEFLALEPAVEVREIGDGPRRPDGDIARLSAFLFNLRSSEVYAAIDWGTAHERQEIGYLQPGESRVATIAIPVDAVPYGQPIRALVYNAEVHKLEETDRASLHGEQTMRIALLVERRTWDDGNKRFGSFTRRMRESLDRLHEIFEDTTAPDAAGLKREPVVDRFRIERIELFDRPIDSAADFQRPSLFDDHPKYDVAIACDAQGPLGGFWLPQYSIGHNFHWADPPKDLWSDWGEQALWHELMHFRGVPDSYIYRIPEGALPGRCDEAIELPEPFRSDLMNNPYQAPQIGALTAAIANSKAGVSRVGACEDTANPYGHQWKWLPRTLAVQINDSAGRPMSGAKVRWYRSAPLGLEDGRIQGVAADRAPDGQAATDAAGQVRIAGDYLGAASEQPQRSLWLLVEVEDAGGHKRFGIVSGLWLNASFAAGGRDVAEWTARFDELRPVTGAAASSPPR